MHHDSSLDVLAQVAGHGFRGDVPGALTLRGQIVSHVPELWKYVPDDDPQAVADFWAGLMGSSMALLHPMRIMGVSNDVLTYVLKLSPLEVQQALTRIATSMGVADEYSISATLGAADKLTASEPGTIWRLDPIAVPISIRGLVALGAEMRRYSSRQKYVDTFLANLKTGTGDISPADMFTLPSGDPVAIRVGDRWISTLGPADRAALEVLGAIPPLLGGDIGPMLRVVSEARSNTGPVLRVSPLSGDLELSDQRYDVQETGFLGALLPAARVALPLAGKVAGPLIRVAGGLGRKAVGALGSIGAGLLGYQIVSKGADVIKTIATGRREGEAPLPADVAAPNSPQLIASDPTILPQIRYASEAGLTPPLGPGGVPSTSFQDFYNPWLALPVGASLFATAQGLPQASSPQVIEVEGPVSVPDQPALSMTMPVAAPGLTPSTPPSTYKGGSIPPFSGDFAERVLALRAADASGDAVYEDLDDDGQPLSSDNDYLVYASEAGEVIITPASWETGGNFFKKIGKGLKKVGKFVSKNVLPIASLAASFIPGGSLITKGVSALFGKKEKTPGDLSNVGPQISDIARYDYINSLLKGAGLDPATIGLTGSQTTIDNRLGAIENGLQIIRERLESPDGRRLFPYAKDWSDVVGTMFSVFPAMRAAQDSGADDSRALQMVDKVMLLVEKEMGMASQFADTIIRLHIMLDDRNRGRYSIDDISSLYELAEKMKATKQQMAPASKSKLTLVHPNAEQVMNKASGLIGQFSRIVDDVTKGKTALIPKLQELLGGSGMPKLKELFGGDVASDEAYTSHLEQGEASARIRVPDLARKVSNLIDSGQEPTPWAGRKWIDMTDVAAVMSPDSTIYKIAKALDDANIPISAKVASAQSALRYVAHLATNGVDLPAALTSLASSALAAVSGDVRPSFSSTFFKMPRPEKKSHSEIVAIADAWPGFFRRSSKRRRRRLPTPLPYVNPLESALPAAPISGAGAGGAAGGAAGAGS